MKTYIHYGSDRFDRNRMRPIKNIDYYIKPMGGLWASPIDAEFGWKDFCIEEEAEERLQADKSFTFTLTEDARVLTGECFRFDGVDSVEEFCKIMEKYRSIPGLNYEALAKDYDAVEFTGTWDGEGGFFYGWDCNSILVMNPDVIIEGGEKY